MRIKRLVLRDYGLYRGTQVLDLAPKRRHGRERPVILVGGHNGAGKTTVLDAVRLCLYGRLALGDRVREVDYQSHLRAQVHRRNDVTVQPGSSSVSLEFDYARHGKRSTYVVTRSWDVRPSGSVEEHLDVLCDGKPLPDVETEFWSEFVRSLIPPGLSQLFFFDGEKIQRLAEEETEADALSESVKALLGLDLVERLQADLDIYMSKRIRNSSAGQQAERLEQVEQKLREVTDRREKLIQDLAQLQTQADYLNAQTNKAEQRLVQSGSGLAGKRTELLARRSSLTTRIGEVERSLRELFEGAFVFSLCHGTCDDVLRQLHAEEEGARAADSLREVDVAIAALASRLNAKATAKKLGLVNGTLTAVTSEVRSFAADWRRERGAALGVEMLHNVSPADRTKLRDLLGDRQVEAAKRAQQLSKELLALEAEQKTVQKHLNAAPDDAELQPLVRELAELQARAAECAATLAQRLAERDTTEVELAALERERRKLLQSSEELERAQSQLALASKTRNALGDYLRQLTEAKVARLEQEAVDCFNLLCRKDDLVRSMSIDSRSYHVQLRDAKGRNIRRSELSAGEKQLYAVALLWGLARVSGRPLPMIIDTPLGRLDSIHRANLVERYFPHASHQVVILSTDTEVDRGCFDKMATHTSHALRLLHHAEGYTEVTPGYFWKGGEHGSELAAVAP